MSQRVLMFSFLLIVAAWSQAEGALFNRAYVNYLLYLKENQNHAQRSSSMSTTPKYVDPTITRPMLGISPWLIVDDGRGHVRLVDRKTL